MVGEIELLKVGRLKLQTEDCGGDQPPQYFFPAKMCLKTRKNTSFQGGKPPGSNARGNPWGPVRTRGDPRPLLGLFATAFCVVCNGFFGIFCRMDCNRVPTSDFWKLDSNFQHLFPQIQLPEFRLRPPTHNSPKLGVQAGWRKSNF